MTIKRSKRFLIETKEKEKKQAKAKGSLKAGEVKVFTLDSLSALVAEEAARKEKEVSALTLEEARKLFAELGFTKAEGQAKGAKYFRISDPDEYFFDEDGAAIWIGSMSDREITYALAGYIAQLSKSHEEALRYCLLFLTQAPKDTQEIYMKEKAEFVEAFKQFPRMKGLLKEALRRELYIPERERSKE